jgi:hypothetical protein
MTRYLKVKCIRGHQSAGLTVGRVYTVAVQVERGTDYAISPTKITKASYILEPDGSPYYPYVWDADRFEVVPHDHSL